MCCVYRRTTCSYRSAQPQHTYARLKTSLELKPVTASAFAPTYCARRLLVCVGPSRCPCSPWMCWTGRVRPQLWGLCWASSNAYRCVCLSVCVSVFVSVCVSVCVKGKRGPKNAYTQSCARNRQLPVPIVLQQTRPSCTPAQQWHPPTLQIRSRTHAPTTTPALLFPLLLLLHPPRTRRGAACLPRLTCAQS